MSETSTKTNSYSNPEFVAEGAYGCIHRPSLHCEPNVKKNYRGKVSKLMKTTDAQKELKEYVFIDRADPNHNFYLGKPESCKLGIVPENRDPIQKCESKDKIMKNPSDFSLIILKDGGFDLQQFATMMLKQKVTEKNKQRVERVFLELKRIFMGIQVFLKNNIMHHDIKDQNIMYDEDKRRCNLIDFGLMENISHSIDLCTESKYGYAHYHWSYPFETEFLNKATFDQFIQLTPDEIHNYVDNITKQTWTDETYWLNVFNIQVNLSKEEKIQHFTVFYDFLLNKLKSMTHAQFVEKCFHTMDVYGLGIALLQFLNDLQKFVDKEFYIQAKTLFHRMITPNLLDRIEIQSAIDNYDSLLENNQIFAKHVPAPPVSIPKNNRFAFLYKNLSKSKTPSKKSMKNVVDRDPKPMLFKNTLKNITRKKETSLRPNSSGLCSNKATF
uniref:Protein kinase domain-containing protein n=1 Tax=viral metagenome TaxID=1070528 RepID=A0A6C0IBX0_9ZZZZ